MAGNPILDVAKSRFNELLDNGPRAIEFAPWKTTVYVYPATVEESARVNRHKVWVDRLFELVLARARDENGKRIFADGEEHTLRNRVRADDVISLGALMMEQEQLLHLDLDETVEGLGETRSSE